MTSNVFIFKYEEFVRKFAFLSGFQAE